MDDPNEQLEELAIAVANDAVDALVEAGWALPVHVCAVDAAGSVAFMRFKTAGRPPVRLLHRAEHEGVQRPVNIMFTSARGEPAFLAIDADNNVGDISVPAASPVAAG